MIREFDLGDILSVTTGKLLSPRHVEGLYDLLGYMTGEPPYTHQLGRFMDECRPHLLRQHPGLAAINDDAVTTENWRAWLGEQVTRHGARLPVATIPQDDHAMRDPIAELRAMAPHAEIIVVKPQSEGR